MKKNLIPILILFIALSLIQVTAINYPINCSLMTDGTPIVINGSAGVTIDGYKQIIWTQCNQSGNLKLTINSSTDYAVVNNYGTIPFEVEQGNMTSYNKESIGNFISAWNLNNSQDSKGASNLTPSGSPVYNTLYLGGGYNISTPGTDYFLAQNIAALNTTSDLTIMAWILPSANTENGRIMTKEAGGACSAVLIYTTTSNILFRRGVCTGAESELTSNRTITAATMAFVAVTTSGQNWEIFINGTPAGKTTSAQVVSNVGSAGYYIGKRASDTAADYKGGIYGLRFYDYAVTSTIISQTYNNSIGLNGYGNIGLSESGNLRSIAFMSPTPENNTVQYQPNNNTIKISVLINNQTELNSTIYLYLNGTGLLNSTPNSTSINFTSLNAGTYFINASLINSDGSTNTSTETRRIDIYTINNTITTPTPNGSITRQLNMTFNSTTTSNLVTINNQNIILDGTSLINLTSANNSYLYDTYILNYSIGNHNLSMNITDSQGRSILNSIIINFTTNKEINITVFSAIDGTKIQNYTLNITDRNTGISRNYPLNNGSALIDTIKLENYTVTIDSPGYAITSQNISLNNQTFQNINISIYTENSINIHIYDETTNLLITENITILFTKGLDQITNSTTTGIYYQEGLADGSWNIKFAGSNYSLKTYTVTVANRSTQNLNAYLSSISQYSIFTIMDFDSGQLIEGASFTQSKLINGSYTIINSKLSDITGRVQFDYIPNAKYQFLISASGYENNLFYLDPVLFSTYNIRLTKTTTLSPGNTPDNLGVYITFYNNETGDSAWYNMDNNTLIWIINSPIGNLETYNLTLETPGANFTFSGILTTGQQFSQNFTLNTTNALDQVIINYCYKSSTSYNKCFRFPYTIIGVYTTTSMIANKDNTYGLGVFERVLIITIAVLFAVGTIFIFGGAIPGLIVTLLIYGFALSTEFVTIWMIFPSLFIGFIMIVSTKGGQY